MLKSIDRILDLYLLEVSDDEEAETIEVETVSEPEPPIAESLLLPGSINPMFSGSPTSEPPPNEQDRESSSDDFFYCLENMPYDPIVESFFE